MQTYRQLESIKQISMKFQAQLTYGFGASWELPTPYITMNIPVRPKI